MSSQGETPSSGADGSWWDAVYTGPGDEVPDTPRADSREGTVDDWFDSATGMISGAAVPEDRRPGGVFDREAVNDDWAETEDWAPPGSGPPTLVEDPLPSVPAQSAPPRPPMIKPLVPPVLPPLPVRPPRIPAADPRVVAPRAAAEDAPDPAPRSADPREPAEHHEPEPQDRPQAPVGPDAPVRPGVGDLEGVRRANEAAAAVSVPRYEAGSEYPSEPTALPPADPDLLTGIVPDTALDGARYGTLTLRAASVRGDEARHRGEVRSDRLLTVRFGEGSEALLLVVLATPAEGTNPAGAGEASRQLAGAVGRSRAELLADLRVGAQERLRYGLQRLTARASVRLPGGSLHALIAPLDPTSRLRAGFGIGAGGLLLLGDDAWYDAYAGRRLVSQQQPGNGGGAAEKGATAAVPPAERFRFRVVAPEPGDVLLLCSEGLARPLREEPAVSDFLADHWSHPHPPGTVDFLRHVQVRANGYAADRTAAALWED